MNVQQQLAVSLLQDNPAEMDLARLNALNEAGWHEVSKVAEALGLGPLLFRNVRRFEVKVPQAIGELLLESLRNNTARNLRILKEFGILAGALQEQGIAFMPLKGVYLCSNVYENPGERLLWDIDLIVPPEEMRRALAVVESTGYRASRPYDLDLEIKIHQHVPAYLKAGAPPLEVHGTLLEPRFEHGREWQDVWERAVLARVGEATVQVLAPIDLLIYLCAHVAYHHLYADSVRSLYDIKLTVERFSAELDWDLVAARAQAWALINSVYLTLRLTKDLLGCGLTESSLQALRPPDFNAGLIQAVLARVFEQMETPPVINAVWARPNLLQRIKGLWDRVVVPPSVLARTYRVPPNSRRLYFYYLVRLKDMLAIHGGDLSALFLGSRQKKDLARRDAELIAYLKWWE